MTLKTTVVYADHIIEIVTDDFSQLHRTIAGVQELERDAAFLQEATGCDSIALRYYRDKEGNEYYGFTDPETRANVTFGQYREGGDVPFYPKAELYTPSNTSEPPPLQSFHHQDGTTTQHDQKRQPLPPIEAYEI